VAKGVFMLVLATLEKLHLMHQVLMMGIEESIQTQEWNEQYKTLNNKTF